MRPAIRVPRVYALADLGVLGRRLPAAVSAIADAGIGWIQLRAKGLAGGEFLRLAEDCQRRLESSDSVLWVNDRPDVAGLAGAAGVHLGQQDLPPAAARRALGDGFLIGRSTHDPVQHRAAEQDPAVDVVALGPIFPTRGKERPEPAVGLETLERLARGRSKPLVAIGGIGVRNAARVWQAGADSIAVLGAVCYGEVRANCKELQQAAEEWR